MREIKIPNEILERNIVHEAFHNASFFLKIRKYIDTTKDKGKSYFNDDNLQKIFNLACAYFDKYQKIPQKNEVEFLLTKIEKDEDKLMLVKSCLGFVFDLKDKLNPDLIDDETKQFIKKARAFEGFLKGQVEFEKGNYDRLAEIFQESAQVNFDKDLGVSVKDVDKVFGLMETITPDATISTGMKSLDRLLDGGFSKKTLISLASPPGIGKTLILGNFAIQAFLQGKKALVYSFEVSDARLLQRYFSNFLRQTKTQLLINNEKLKEVAKEYMSDKDGDVVLKVYPPNTICTHDLMAHINDLKMYNDWVPDIIIVDYLLIMNANDARLSVDDSYHNFKRVAEDLRSMAMELNVPVLTAVQINRDGMDDAGGSKAITTAKQISESRGIYDTVDFFATINQTARQKTKSELMLYVDKNRNGATGEKIYCEVDYNYMLLQERTPSAAEIKS